MKAKILVVAVFLIVGIFVCMKQSWSLVSGKPIQKEAINNSSVTSNTNDFVIGIEGSESRNTRDGNGNIQTSILNSSGYPSSAMNVVSQDGFNTLRSFYPDLWITYSQMTQLTQLVGNNGLKIFYDDEKYYSPNFSQPPATNPSGLNSYQFNSQSSTYMNLNSLYSQVYSNPVCSSYIWGHVITGESNWYHHFYDHTNNYSPPGFPCSPHQSPTDYANCLNNYFNNYGHYESDDWLYTEVPPQNVSDAFNYFDAQKQLYNIQAQKLIQVQAHHGVGLNSNPIGYDVQGIFKAGDYLTMSNVINGNNGDLLIEGSYFTNEFANYLSSNNFLGKFESVKYSKQFFDRVIVEIDLEHGNWSNNSYLIHTNPVCPNANQQWHQAYGSIIHGASGVTFYGLLASYDSNNQTDISNQAVFFSNNQVDRYSAQYFPDRYKSYTRHLGRELRYLVNKGFLSTDKSTLVGSRVDQLDPFCILPSSNSYIPSILSSTNAKDFFDVQASINNVLNPPITNPKTTEQYGIRYTIRQNGNGEVIIILANMTPFHLSSVPLNFNNISNLTISNSTGVDVLFESATQNIFTNTYKTNRNSNIDLVNNTVGQSYYIPFLAGNKTASLAFAPFDIHVLKFRPSLTYPITGYNNGWQQIWSNNGDGNLGDWGPLLSSDKVVKGNFNGGSEEELLFIQSAYANAWATIEQFNITTSTWEKQTGNLGNNLIGPWFIQATDKFIAGDFNGDGKDELLCMRSGSSGVLAMLLYLNGTNWQSLWTNNASGNIGAWPITSADKYIIGDYNSDGKDDILAIQEPTSTTAKVHLIQFKSGGFNSYWNNSSNDYIGTWNIQIVDNILAGDLDGNGFSNQIVCFQTNGNMSSVLTFNAGSWSSNWVNTTGSFGGWTIPGTSTNDKVVIGNLDSDPKDEIMFIQRCNPCGWSTTMDLNNNFAPQWNWSNHNYSGAQQNFIDTWDVSIPTTLLTDYLIVKAKSTSNSSQLLAWSKKSCGSNNVLISLFETSLASNYKPVNDLTTSDLWIYPNPANETIYMDLSKIEGTHFGIRIYDLAGRIIYKNEVTVIDRNTPISIDLSEFMVGVYLVSITNNMGQTNINKLVVNH